MAGPKIDVSEFTVLIKASIEFPTVQSGKRKYVGWLDPELWAYVVFFL